MGFKKTNCFNFNWQSTSPVPFSPNNPLSGVTTGTMSGTNTIYTNIQDLTNTDNQGLEISWTGTPTGTITVQASISGTFFFPLTFNPALSQPAGSSGGYGIDVNQYPFRYMFIEYVNSSGSGSIVAWIQSKDLN